MNNDLEVLGWFVFGAIALVSVAVIARPRRGNRHVGLPAPKYDDRDSIANFRRMHRL